MSTQISCIRIRYMRIFGIRAPLLARAGCMWQPLCDRTSTAFTFISQMHLVRVGCGRDTMLKEDGTHSIHFHVQLILGTFECWHLSPPSASSSLKTALIPFARYGCHPPDVAISFQHISYMLYMYSSYNRSNKYI